MSAPDDIHGARRFPRLRALSHPDPAPGPPGHAAAGIAVSHIEQAPEPLKCVWSHDGGCEARIPVNLAMKSWERQMSLRDTPEGFFHVTWRGRTWLAYGASDGSVRGVYCPTHTAMRAGRQEDANAGAPLHAATVP